MATWGLNFRPPSRYRPGVRHKRMFVQTVKLCPPKIANFFQKKIISRRLFFNFLNFVRKITSLELFKILWKKLFWWLYNVLRPDSTSAFSRRNAKYFACFFWIVSNRVEIIYSSSRNSKETGEIIRISPRKSARGIRPLESIIREIWLSLPLPRTGLARIWLVNRIHETHLIG